MREIPSKITFPSINHLELSRLEAVVSNEEIKRAVFNMGGLKAPSEDGFPAVFYQTNWDVFHDDLRNFVKLCMVHKHKINEVNNTLVVLIPKVEHPTFITQFWPISLYNVTYKTITKVIVNRFKGILPAVISPFQVSFVPGRRREASWPSRWIWRRVTIASVGASFSKPSLSSTFLLI